MPYIQEVPTKLAISGVSKAVGGLLMANFTPSPHKGHLHQEKLLKIRLLYEYHGHAISTVAI